MNFVESGFIVSFPVFLLLYYLLRNNHERQNNLLTLFSYYFYGWFDWRFLFLLLFTTVVDYYAGLIIDYAKQNRASSKAESDSVIRLTLAGSITCNLIVLGYFKYFNFFTDSFYRLFSYFGFEIDIPVTSILLPAGISFYTFQSIGYVFDVYDNRVRAIKRFSQYALYVSFFPHLVAGPILRATNILPKIVDKRVITPEMFLKGIQLALYGLFLKLVIADNMGLIVDRAFALHSPDGAILIVAVYAFAFQIYGDFMGYTHIARGISRMMGFELPLNFRLPYLASNPSDFWRRWHISLSTWLRDYLYIRLGGSREGNAKTARNLMITMLLGGLWHGAAGNFILWGAFHGILLTVHRFLPKREPDVARGTGTVHWFKVFLFFQVTCIGWLLFRVDGLDDLQFKIEQILFNTDIAAFWTREAGLVLMAALPLMAFEVYQYYRDDLEPWNRWPAWLRIVWYISLIVGIAHLMPHHPPPFIYFQF